MESLYTKYRPQTFEQVVGQKHVVETLKRAVVEGRTSHAYLCLLYTSGSHPRSSTRRCGR